MGRSGVARLDHADYLRHPAGGACDSGSRLLSLVAQLLTIRCSGGALNLNPIPTELTTAATDAVLAVLAVVCIRWLWNRRETDPRRIGLWSLVLGLLAVASGLGTVAHGLDLSDGVTFWLWQPLYLCLGLVVALFAIAAVYDGIGPRTARRLLIPALVLGAGFYFVTLAFPGTFLVFVVYEALAMLFALALYLRLALRNRAAWTWLMVFGIALNIVAAGIQATGTVRLTLLVPFDHNGVFHIVQMAAILVLVAGVARGQQVRQEGTSPMGEETR